MMMGEDRSCRSRCCSEHDKVATQWFEGKPISLQGKRLPASPGAKAKVLIQKVT